MAKKYYVDEHAAGLIEWAVKMLRSLKGGPGVRVLRDNTGMTISLTPVKEYRPEQSRGIKLALGKITGHSGSHSAYVYTQTFQDSSTSNSYNSFDWNGTVPGMMIGSPCSLGITVGASGQVNSGTCVIAAVGSTGWILFTWDPLSSRWTFAQEPSAQ